MYIYERRKFKVTDIYIFMVTLTVNFVDNGAKYIYVRDCLLDNFVLN